MNKPKIGRSYRIGGKYGAIMECTGYDEKNDEYILKDEHSTFYYKKGDCTLIEIQKYEQLKLF